MSVPQIEVPSIVLKNPKARSIVANVIILSQLVGIAVLVMMHYGLVLSLSPQWLWVPLGGLLFAMIANPFLLLAGFKEPLSVVLSALHLLFYVYVVRPESLRNALLVFFVYFLVVAIFELPRRFEV